MKGSEYYMHVSHNGTCQHANRKAVHCKLITKQENMFSEGNKSTSLLESFSYVFSTQQELHSH